MTRFILYISITIGLLLCSEVKANTVMDKEPTIAQHFEALIDGIRIIKATYRPGFKNLQEQLTQVSVKLKTETLVDKQVALLLKKDALKEQWELLALNEEKDISKIRYIKGLQIIKILYEKTLSLDHHFSSVTTLNEINKISNPNNYPEFASVKEQISQKENKKEGFDLSNILGNNIYTSVIHSFVSLFNNTNATKQEKESNLKEVECILDFTLRMNNDLNTIYFETVFLQKSNETIMSELQQLFVDYTKPIKYRTPLKECRQNDDWDLVREHLGEYLTEMKETGVSENDKQRTQKMLINLEFSIDRLLQFITQYNAFIDQGGKFYEKFEIMLNSYENQSQCENKIPIEYKKLKDGVAIAVEKFKTAYKPVEINGSKMKEVLYGINEYD